MVTGLSPARAATTGMSDLGELLDLTRPGLARVAAELVAGDEAGAAAELKVYYAGRSGIEYPGVGGEEAATRPPTNWRRGSSGSAP